MYKKGRGVPKDFAQAADWYRKAAEQGHAWAQYVLGGLYKNGEGVTQDYECAYVWLSLSIKNGVFMNGVGKLRDAVAKVLSTAQFETAKGVLAEYFELYRARR